MPLIHKSTISFNDSLNPGPKLVAHSPVEGLSYVGLLL